MLELGLKQPKFSYEGEYYRQPMSAISQRAVQQPMPPMWITSVDPAFVSRAVKSDHHVFVSGGDGGVEKMHAAHLKASQGDAGPSSLSNLARSAQ